MLKKVPAIISAVVLTVGILSTAVQSMAKPEYTKKEKKACTTCHTAMKSKDLNDTGKCYGEKKDLKACVK